MRSIVAIRPLFLSVLLLLPSLTFAQSKHAAVAMPDAFSAQAAKKILSDGGNAVDAAVAAQFVLAVTFPEAGNVGGGGFMLIRHDKETAFLDYRETAPKRAHKDMYLDENGDVIENLSLYGVLASGVPGSVAGMWEAHQKFGVLAWSTLLEPAIALAEEGFIVPEKLYDRVAKYSKRLDERHIDVNFNQYFGAIQAHKRFVQPDLANVLKRIQKNGKKGFYSGQTAALIADFMQKNGGLITLEDLAAYEAKWRKPLTAPWRNKTLVTAPPPSSGGIAIIQWLSLYELARKNKSFAHNESDYIHVLSEVGKRVFADRAEYLGDPDFFPVPVAQLIAPNYLKRRAQGISLSTISNTERMKPGLAESEDTTHFSIIDSDGNAVSNTTTINLSFGSGTVVEGAGFLLNDEMDDFSAKPGVANYFGALGGDANAIAPGKRMLSSMTPTIVMQGDNVVLVTGSPGGTTILSSVYQSILNTLEFGMTAQQAVNAPRFHHQLHPKDTIRVHDGFSSSTLTLLKDKGYTIDNRRFGDLQIITQQEGVLDAGSEANGRGEASVFPLAN